MDRERLDKLCQWSMLGLVLGILIYGPLAIGAVRPTEFVYIRCLTVGVLGLWFLRAWIHPEPRLLWPPVCWAVVAFLGYAVYRYFTADIEYVARQELIKILCYAVVFFAVVNNLNRQEHAQIIACVLVGLAALISIYAVYQFLTHAKTVWHFIRPAQYAGRGSGTYINPNNLAGFLEMVLPLGLAYTLIARLSTTARVLLGYATLVILVGIGTTVSRGGWLAVALALTAFFGVLVQQRDYRLPAAVFFGVLGVVAIFFVLNAEFSHQRFAQLFEQQGVENLRHDLWKASAQMWRDNFWRGVGPGHFEHRWRQYRPENMRDDPLYVHNDYLNTLVDWGVIGAALIGVVVIVLYWGSWQTWRAVSKSGNDLKSKKSNRVALVIGAATGLSAILFHSVADFNMQIPANAMLAITLMALLTGHLRFASDRYWLNHTLAVRLIVSILVVTGSIYLGGQTVRNWKELEKLKRVAAEESAGRSGSKAELVYLESAHTAEPMEPEVANLIGRFYLSAPAANEHEKNLHLQEAMKWIALSMKLNPYSPNYCINYGLCLDGLDKPTEANTYFERAVSLDPNGYFPASMIGRHYAQTKEWSKAKVALERSLHLRWYNNEETESYLKLANQKLSGDKQK